MCLLPLSLSAHARHYSGQIAQAADFVLGFQLVICLSTSVTGKGPECEQPTRSGAAHMSFKEALGGEEHFGAPHGCVPGSLSHFTVESTEKRCFQKTNNRKKKRTPTVCPSVCFSAWVKPPACGDLIV